jgi:outer membrane lipoprotein-sorting protein/peroxiredoxin
MQCTIQTTAAFTTLLMMAAFTAAAPARADEKAEAILAQCRAATAKLQCLKADLWITQGPNALIGTVTLKKPNKAWIQMSGIGPDRIVSDGKTLLVYVPSKHQCLKMDPGPDGSRIPAVAGPVGVFFLPQSIGHETASVTPTYVGRRKFEGADYEVIDLVTPGAESRSVRCFISPEDFLLHRVVAIRTDAAGAPPVEATLKNLRLNPPVGDDAFIWQPPADAVLIEVPSEADLEKRLIPVGKPPPPFRLVPATGGATVRLADALRGKKALLLCFWSLDSPVSRTNLPFIEKAYRKFRDQGLEVLAVERGSAPAEVAKFGQESGLTFTLLTAGPGPDYPVENDYGVAAHPTLYLVGGDDRVLWRALGTDEAGLSAALAGAGLK